MNRTYWVWGLLAVPSLLILYRFSTDAITYGQALHQSGQFSVAFLVLVLSITPLRHVFRNAPWTRWLLTHRRYLGVASFAYASLHTIIYLEHKWAAGLILEEGLEVPLATGWLALFLFLVLALTSNNPAVRVLGRYWKSLHQWVFVAAGLVFVHWILASFDPAVAYAGVALLLVIESLRLAPVKS